MTQNTPNMLAQRFVELAQKRIRDRLSFPIILPSVDGGGQFQSMTVDLLLLKFRSLADQTPYACVEEIPEQVGGYQFVIDLSAFEEGFWDAFDEALVLIDGPFKNFCEKYDAIVRGEYSPLNDPEIHFTEEQREDLEGELFDRDSNFDPSKRIQRYGNPELDRGARYVFDVISLLKEAGNPAEAMFEVFQREGKFEAGLWNIPVDRYRDIDASDFEVGFYYSRLLSDSYDRLILSCEDPVGLAVESICFAIREAIAYHEYRAKEHSASVEIRLDLLRGDADVEEEEVETETLAGNDSDFDFDDSEDDQTDPAADFESGGSCEEVYAASIEDLYLYLQWFQKSAYQVVDPQLTMSGDVHDVDSAAQVLNGIFRKQRGLGE
ncbi:MAG TPA: hypothetical protein PLK94_09325 [Alphaproteobacteria bacterium]|nr:hypothetical protein [Alphaproteobacteria bacterium]